LEGSSVRNMPHFEGISDLHGLFTGIKYPTDVFLYIVTLSDETFMTLRTQLSNPSVKTCVAQFLMIFKLQLWFKHKCSWPLKSPLLFRHFSFY
jgi:hypothetical protein